MPTALLAPLRRALCICVSKDLAPGTSVLAVATAVAKPMQFVAPVVSDATRPQPSHAAPAALTA